MESASVSSCGSTQYRQAISSTLQAAAVEMDLAFGSLQALHWTRVPKAQHTASSHVAASRAQNSGKTCMHREDRENVDKVWNPAHIRSSPSCPLNASATEKACRSASAVVRSRSVQQVRYMHRTRRAGRYSVRASIAGRAGRPPAGARTHRSGHDKTSPPRKQPSRTAAHAEPHTCAAGGVPASRAGRRRAHERGPPPSGSSQTTARPGT